MSSRPAVLCVLLLVAVVACASVRPPTVDAPSTGAPTLRCNSLDPSSDPEAVSRVGALFSRPQNATDLLRNLKLAYDTDLIHQPGFYAAGNLTKFFAGTAATTGERTTISPDGSAFRDIVITADGSVFPQITIELRRSCSVEVRFEAPKQLRPDHLNEALLIHLLVGFDTGFTLGAVRGVFGPASTQYVDYGADAGGRSGEPKDKGALIYENREGQAGARPGIEGAEVTFNVRLDPPPTSDEQRRHQALLNDSDNLREIRFSEIWR